MSLENPITGLLEDCSLLFENQQFYQAFVGALEQTESISSILHSHQDIFKSLNILLSDLSSRLKSYETLLEKIRILLNTYAILGIFSPRVSLLLRHSIIFIVDGLMTIPGEKLQKTVLEEKDIKRLSTVYATVILNITTNPKIWLGGTQLITLIDWKKELEKHKIDMETFLEYKDYLTNKFMD